MWGILCTVHILAQEEFAYSDTNDASNMLGLE